jgi:hypothetical protein
MLDLHPVTEEQVEAGGRRIGVVEDPEYRIDLPNAEARLAEAAEAGLYTLEAEVEFDVLQHFDEAEDLLAGKKERLAVQPRLVRRIRSTPPPFVLREHVVLRRFRA